MNIPILTEDLIHSFQKGKEANQKVINQVESQIEGIKQPLAKRFFQTGLSLLLEFILWVLAIACLGAIIFLERLHPFNLISNLREITLPDGILPKDFTTLNWAIRGLFLLLGLSFLWLAKIISQKRKRAKRLTELSKELQTLQKSLLERQSEIRGLIAKYPVDLGQFGKSEEEKDASDDTPKALPDGPDDILL